MAIRIPRSALRGIGDPKFVRFLVKNDGTSLIMEPNVRMDLKSHRVPLHKGEHWKLEITSTRLCRLLQSKTGWVDGESYRVPGLVYVNQRKAVFDLESAETIPRVIGV